MCDSTGVRGGEAGGDLGGKVEESLQRNNAAVDFGAEPASVYQFGYKVRCRAFKTEIVNSDDVRMRERAGGARFLQEK